MRDTLPLSRIVQGKNPRTKFDPQEMAELEDGIRPFGVLQAIVVRPIEGTDQYEIVFGERRWRAAKNVFGDDYEMPVDIRDVGDSDAEAIAVIENHHRADMSVPEEALAAQRQLYRNNGNKEEAAKHLGWNVTLLERRLALLACSPAVLAALTERQIQIGHAELLAGVPSETQDKVLGGVVAHKVPVGVLKKQLGQFARRLSDAIFDTAQCGACVHNSARQAGLFSESLGDGYCQHPTHFDELTMQAVDVKATALRDEYQVVKVVKASDGFVPLRLAAEGELGVGKEQYAACKGCQSFGCAVSALPGTYGQVTGSLCFDTACNSKKVALRRKVEAGADQQAGTDAGTAPKTAKSGGKQPGKAIAKPGSHANKPKPSIQPPQRVVQFRVEQWRRWVANALMAHGERNQRVLVALTLSGRGADLRAAQYADVMAKMTGYKKGAADPFSTALEKSDALPADCLPRLVEAVAASAAFGVDESNLVALMNYLDIDEAQHFQIDRVFLDLFTTSELESLSEETGLRKAMGERFKHARAGKKEAFVAALLSIKGFSYRGTVPQIMRYPRKVFKRGRTGVQDSPEGDTGSEQIPNPPPELTTA
jgi:ParB family transcriptional regulator, chromosome partitioning protein